MVISIYRKKITNSLKIKLVLILILVIGFLLRIYNLNWDQGYHLHPDERQIAIVTSNISLPDTLNFSTLLSPDSPLNPHFFAYGSLPIYLLKFIGYLFSGLDHQFITYEKINLLGRLLSSIFDILTIFLIYKITKLLFNSNKKAITASLVYALSVFPIQLSHFYAVDTVLTFFVCFTLYRSMILYRYLSYKNAIFVGVGFGLSLATKVSATVLVVAFISSLFIETLLSLKKEIFSKEIGFLRKIWKYLKSIFNPKFWIKNKSFKLKKVVTCLFLITLITFVTFAIFEPFAIIDFSEFWSQIKAQSAMTKDAFVFPYTLQYVNTTPYLYQLKNIILWGLGPAFGILAIIGFMHTFIRLFKGLFSPGNEEAEGSQLIIIFFFVAYFLVVGNFEVKFMRYCLPLYPILAIFAANIFTSLKKPIVSVLMFANLIWLLAFLNIYNSPNSRVMATDWINKNIPTGSMVLREHWDDGLPLGYNINLQLIDLPLYESDSNPQKWPLINNYLASGDYLILASNRLYTPLQKLTECNKLPQDKCYYKTSKYYEDLFAGKLGYEKVAEFANYPRLFNLTIDDQSADESFTVYDHPKVIIFKNNHLNKDEAKRE